LAATREFTKASIIVLCRCPKPPPSLMLIWHHCVVFCYYRRQANSQTIYFLHFCCTLSRPLHSWVWCIDFWILLSEVLICRLSSSHAWLQLRKALLMNSFKVHAPGCGMHMRGRNLHALYAGSVCEISVV
jgi:hypothetical protein